MGMLAKPNISNIAVACAAICRSGIAERKAITPRYKNNKISSEVKRASQTHHAPHIGLAQTLPVNNAKKVNHAPKKTLPETINSANLIRKIKPIMEKNAIIK